MQRRAAALYVAFFLVISVASYSLIATAEEPHVEFANPDYTLSENETFTVGGTEYTVSSLEATASSGGGGHGGGGGGGIQRTGSIAWTNQSAQHTATWANNSTVSFDNTTYRVLIPNTSDPSSFVLQNQINRSQVLANDPQADDQTINRSSGEFVVIEDQNGSRLVPADEYFAEPTNRTVNEGATINYNGNRTTVANVTNASATLQWTAPRNNTVDVSDNGNVTLGGTTYLAHFRNNQTLVLTQDFQNYNQQTARIDRYHQYVNGLWGVSIMGGVAAILLAGMAYLPSRY